MYMFYAIAKEKGETSNATGGRPPQHIQTREYEGFYVLDGELIFNVEGKQVISKAGTMINIPPNVIHSFKIIQTVS